MEKKYCQTHHLYYSSVECPCCFSDRISRFEEKHYKIIQAEKEDATITEASLEALKEKFNNR